MKTKILLICIVLTAFILRFFDISGSPPSLYWDEASLGYNAYSIATSLKDEHGEFLPLARFSAFGDYKPPGYIYAASLSVGLFGLNEISVRLPSVLAGTGMVLLTYLFVRIFFSSQVALVAALFMAVSPWSVHLSRGAFEANLAAFFNLAGVYCFLIGFRKKMSFLLSMIFFVLSFYTFNANRIIAPILILGLLFLYSRKILQNLSVLIITCILGAALLIPSISFLFSRESKVRFQEVSILTNLVPLETSNMRIAVDENNWIGKIIHNRRVLYGLEFLKHYADNFQGRFLFTKGDANLRLSIQDMGQLYPWDLLLLSVGLYIIVTKYRQIGSILALWILTVPIPAAFAKETPHALRIVSILPTFQIIAAVGLVFIFRKLKGKRKVIGMIIASVILSFQLFYFTHIFFNHYPVRYSGAWQYGYKEMVNFVFNHINQYDNVFVTDKLGRPYIYFAFYGKIPTDTLLSEEDAQRDNFGFWNISKIGKIHMTLNGLSETSGKTLVVSEPGHLPEGYKKINQIINLEGNGIFDIGNNL